MPEDGRTWDTAFRDLQDALAEMNPPAVNEIWVAAATYHPDEEAPFDQSASFSMLDDVGVLGGFLGNAHPQGGETDRAQRDPVNNVTILSGTVPGGTARFFFGVVVPEDLVTATAVLDGFTIRDGLLSGALMSRASPTFIRCIFTENGGQTNPGGGMRMFGLPGQPASPTVLNCTFTFNVAPGGGAVDMVLANPKFINCAFRNNSAVAGPQCVGCNGGAIRASLNTGLTLINCVFAENYAENQGGAIWVDQTVASLNNCTFWKNEAAGLALGGGGIAGGLFAAPNNPVVVRNCIFRENSTSGGVVVNEETQITPTDPGQITVTFSDIEGLNAFDILGSGNIDVDPGFAPGAGNLRLFYGSPCIDAADTTIVPCDEFDVDEDGFDCVVGPQLTPDLDLRDRAIDDPDTDDTGIPGPPGPIEVVDMGSYEFAPCPSDVNRDCVVNVLDLIDLLLCFGLPDDPPCDTGQDINGDGTVNVLDLIDLLLDFGTNCSCAAPGPALKSLEEALEEAGLTMHDWDDFMDVMEEGTQEEKDNWHCWMTHYLSCHDPFGTCNPPPPNCPGSDPFGGHRH